LDASPDGPVPFHYPGQSLEEDFGVSLKWAYFIKP
jgi:phospholipid/cholesterol/gamma-HCH transport system ATP-binding protein